MPADRFENLEGDKPLPENIKKTLQGLGRFDHLEIGTRHPEPESPAPKQQDKVLCLHCGQPNERERQTCWACFRPLGPEAQKKAAPKGPDDITIVLDGINYRSSDPNLPPDVKELMDQIRKNGFSQELLAQWRSWRATRNESQLESRPYPDSNLVPVENVGKDPLTGNEVFKGQRSAVIRLDGKIYTSTDMELTPEIKELFQYIENYGVTPALMEHLREIGKKTTVRPATTPAPSVEDLAFWKDVRGGGAQPPTEEEQKPAIESLGTGRPEQSSRFASGLILAITFALYVLYRLFF